ncbi:hypothetical protein EVAR_102906_1 [Eumeta japonica]|uniref:Uncharacterized protein n=1 Tax=Eumeta variegata TaxID=151549 RepID=A0A4C1ZNT8_EUMVA|nr:hypothetical protein EVAR_102906_1 [Eumeta japonica]
MKPHLSLLFKVITRNTVALTNSNCLEVIVDANYLHLEGGGGNWHPQARETSRPPYQLQTDQPPERSGQTIRDLLTRRLVENVESRGEKMDAAAPNVTERPMRPSPSVLASSGSAVRAEGGVPTAPRQSEASASPHAANCTLEYDEMLKMGIKTECDVEDSAIIQVLDMSHSHILEGSVAGSSLLVKEEGDFTLKTENEMEEIIVKQELDIEPIFVQPKITLRPLPPSDQSSERERVNSRSASSATANEWAPPCPHPHVIQGKHRGCGMVLAAENGNQAARPPVRARSTTKRAALEI